VFNLVAYFLLFPLIYNLTTAASLSSGSFTITVLNYTLLQFSSLGGILILRAEGALRPGSVRVDINVAVVGNYLAKHLVVEATQTYALSVQENIACHPGSTLRPILAHNSIQLWSHYL
jgi:hypothetical protein